MMIAGINIEPFLLSVAAKMAHLSDEQQAAFLNAFAKELHDVCGSKHAAGMQAYSIGKLANEELKNVCDIINSVDK